MGWKEREAEMSNPQKGWKEREAELNYSNEGRNSPLPVSVKPGQSMADQALTFAQETGRGASAGLIKYPAAVVMLGLDKVIGDGKMSWKDATESLEEQKKENFKERPAAAITGNLAGAVGLAALTGGTGVGGQLAANTATGAVSGFTEKEDLKDAALGAGIGAIFGTAGHVFGKGVDAAKESIAKTNIINKIQKAIRDEDIDSLRKAFPSKDDNVVINYAKSYVKALTKGMKGETIDDAALAVQKQNVEKVLKDIAKTTYEQRQSLSTMNDIAKKNGFKDWQEFSAANQGLIPPTKEVMSPVRPRDFTDISSEFQGTKLSQHAKHIFDSSVSAGKGALFGLGLGYLAGDKNPLTPIESAMVAGGAAGLVAAGKQAAMNVVTKRVINESSPLFGTNVPTNLAIQGTVPPVVRAFNPEENQEEVSKPPLKRLADDFRIKFTSPGF